MEKQRSFVDSMFLSTRDASNMKGRNRIFWYRRQSWVQRIFVDGIQLWQENKCLSHGKCGGGVDRADYRDIQITRNGKVDIRYPQICVTKNVTDQNLMELAIDSPLGEEGGGGGWEIIFEANEVSFSDPNTRTYTT